MARPIFTAKCLHVDRKRTRTLHQRAQAGGGDERVDGARHVRKVRERVTFGHFLHVLSSRQTRVHPVGRMRRARTAAPVVRAPGGEQQEGRRVGSRDHDAARPSEMKKACCASGDSSATSAMTNKHGGLQKKAAGDLQGRALEEAASVRLP